MKLDHQSDISTLINGRNQNRIKNSTFKSIILIFVMISSRFKAKEVFTRQVTLTPISIQRAALAAPIVGFTVFVWVIPTTINCCCIYGRIFHFGRLKS